MCLKDLLLWQGKLVKNYKGVYMKIGILTFHRAINYGALLQAYALEKVLNDIGAEAEIIDYRAPYIENLYYKGNPRNNFNKKLKFLVGRVKSSKKYNKFKMFVNKHIKLSPTYKNSVELKENDKQYRMYISGSDQVWNPDCSGFDKVYFLDFTAKEKKASYAASIGTKTINKKYETEALKLIADYSYISVREKQGKEYLENNNIISSVEIDPTLLLDKTYWVKISKKTKYQKEKYILLYMLVYSESLVQFAKKLAKEKGCKLIRIGRGHDKEIIYAPGIGPDEYISLINDAEYVVTNSFHGTAFSINLNKRFFVELQNAENARNSRMEDMMGIFGLESRLIDTSSGKFNDEEIDYSAVNEKLIYERNKSINYLKKIIN